jgi:hypothetical protein
MLLDTLAKSVAWFPYQLVKKVESRLGYRLELNPDHRKWIDGNIAFDMTPVWEKYGLEATGVNYFTIGKVVNGISSRFDSNSPYYQAWLGGYIVRFSQSRAWSVEDHFRLGEADQKNWLSIYGVNNPLIKLPRMRETGTCRIGNYKGTLYQGGGDSNTDVGDSVKLLYLSILQAGGVYFFKRSNPKLNLSYSNLIPDWKTEKRLAPYQIIHLEGYVAIVEIDSKTKAILYVNGCQFTDKNGKKTDTFNKLKKEFKEVFRKFRIIKTISNNY